MKRFLIAFAFAFVSLPLCGCGSEEPAVIADPNDYSPYQASPEEIKAQQAESNR